MRARERAERDRRIGRAVGRRADLGDGNAKRVRGDGVTVDVRELTLIRAEAERSLTLVLLGRAIVLAHGEMDVGSRDVVLEIDEGLLPVSLRLSVGNAEDAPGSESLGLAGVDVDPRQGVLLIECDEQRGDRLVRLSQRLLEAELAGHGTDAVDTGLGPSGRGHNERKAGVVPLRAPAVVTIEMDRRRQATGARHRIALDFGARSGERVYPAVELAHGQAGVGAPTLRAAS